MALHIVADRVQETTTTTGTGTISLAGAAAQCQSFIAGVGDGNECDYIVMSGDGSNWEAGITYIHAGSPPTLTRDIITASTNGGSAISLTGTSTVYLAPTARNLYGRFGRRPARPPLSSFSWVNQGGATAADYRGGPLTLIVPAITSGADQWRCLGQTPPAAPWTLTAELELLQWTTGGMQAGLYIQDSAGKLVVLDYSTNTNFNVQHFSSVSAFVAASKVLGALAPSRIWLRIYNDGTNFNFYVSGNGADWVLFLQESVTAYLGTTISSVGFGGDIYSTSATAAGTVSLWSFELKTGTGNNVQWV